MSKKGKGRRNIREAEAAAHRWMAMWKNDPRPYVTLSAMVADVAMSDNELFACSVCLLGAMEDDKEAFHRVWQILLPRPAAQGQLKRLFRAFAQEFLEPEIYQQIFGPDNVA